MAKYFEDLTVAAWGKSGGSSSVSANAAAAAYGNTTADQIAARTATQIIRIIQQQVAGLVDGGTQTRTSQTAKIAAGIACGAGVVSAKDNSESPLRVCGTGSDLADHKFLEVSSGGELILAGGTGNGLPLRRTAGRHQPVRMVGRAQSEDAGGSDRRLHPPIFQSVNQERTEQ